MDSWNSNNVAEAIQRKLKQIINLCIEEYDGECDFKQKVFKKTNELMFGFVKSASFNFNTECKYHIKDSKFSILKYDRLIKGQIEFEYYEKSNPAKYGAPGFCGNENGEICQYPDYSDMYYQWYECYNKWIDVTYKVCENNNQNKFNSFTDKLMNNAAFEPLWGNNRSGGDTFSSNRYKNGGDLWGNPQIRKPLGGFKKISANVYKSIYNFTLDLKSAINHY